MEDDDRRWPLDHLRIDVKAVGRAEVGMNFDGSEPAYEDGPHAARRRRILGPGRAIVLRHFRVRGGGSRQTQADEWEQRARSEPEKPRTGQRGLRQLLKTGVACLHFSSPFGAAGLPGSGWSVRRAVSADQTWPRPPSTNSSMPVTKLESSEARNTAALATSSGSPMRPIGMVATILAMMSGDWISTSGVLIGPGLRTFERMRRSFNSTVQVRTRLRTAALVAP